MTKKYDVKITGTVNFERTIPVSADCEFDAELGAKSLFNEGVELDDGDELTIESVTAMAPKFDVEVVDGNDFKEKGDG